MVANSTNTARLSKLALILLAVLAPHQLYAISAASGFCETGNNTVAVGGLTSTTRVQRSFPSCTITVFISGTATAATIYSDNAATPTPLTNPFTANANGTWTFFAANGTYDVVRSGAGISPSLTTSSVTIFDPSSATGLVLDCINPRFTGANASIRIAACITALPSTGGVVDARGFQGAQVSTVDWFGGKTGAIVLVGAATFSTSATIVVPAHSGIVGMGRASKFLDNSLTAEMVRLDGNYSFIDNVWLSGSGKQSIPTAVNGRRGIWIGNGISHDATPDFTDYARVQNVIIDQFVGNGISGDYRFAVIKDNIVVNNTDANIFLQPASVNNLIEGNTIQGSRYSGIDVNGSSNRIINNYISGNGGGQEDTASWEGILITYITANPTQPNGDLNIVEGNTIADNLGCGVSVYSSALTAGIVNAPFGNVISNNIATGHTNQYNQSGQTREGWSAGFCILGGSDTVVNGNIANANSINYVVSGVSSHQNTQSQLINNQSLNAATNAALTGLGKPSGVGYLFPGTARIVAALGGSPANNLVLTGNWDRYSASDCYRVDLTGAAALAWTGWTVDSNHWDTCGGYGFNIASPSSWGDGTTWNNWRPTNFGTGAASGNFNGFNSSGLTANSATPSISNSGMPVTTQNTTSTTITNFTGGIPGQQLTVIIGDAVTTIAFTSTSGSNMRGNGGVPLIASSGDVLDCKYDATNWHCGVQPKSQGFGEGLSAGVQQMTNKSTAVSFNAAGCVITSGNCGAVSGQITMNGAALAADTTVSFTMTNAKIVSTNDQVLVYQIGGPNPGSYDIQAAVSAIGSASIAVRNITTGSLSDAVVIGFKILHQ